VCRVCRYQPAAYQAYKAAQLQRLAPAAACCHR
jgi:hypothetical protein